MLTTDFQVPKQLQRMADYKVKKTVMKILEKTIGKYNILTTYTLRQSHQNKT